MRNIFAALLLVLLDGCATIYQPQGVTGGYSQTQLAENVFQITFKGNDYIDRETIADYALLRSAEVALENGFKYFVIVDAQQYSKPTSTNTIFCLKEKPEGFAYDAGIIVRSMKQKYQMQ